MEKNNIVSVIGLGYVGLAVAAAFGKKYKTIGFDIDAERILELKQGFDRNFELSKEDLKESQIEFSTDPESVRQACFHIVALPTPTGVVHRPLFKPLFSATEELGKHIKKGDIIVFESTVYPGLTEEKCLPLLEKNSGMKGGIDFYIGYSPERINPGDTQRPFSKIRKIVSSNDIKALDVISEMYQSVLEEPVFRASSIKVAETAKVIENTQRDVNIAFMNEVAKICDLFGIDTHDVLEAAKTKWNFLNFQPGLVGGHCISVDPYYLTHQSEILGYVPEIILSARKMNEGMSKFIANKCIKKLIQSGCNVLKSRIAILGFTYKEDCPDIRNTKVADLVKEFQEFGLEPQIYDSMADKNEVLDEYGYVIKSGLPTEPVHCLIVAVKHKQYLGLNIEQIKKMLVPAGILFDVKTIYDTKSLRQAGINVFCL